MTDSKEKDDAGQEVLENETQTDTVNNVTTNPDFILLNPTSTRDQNQRTQPNKQPQDEENTLPITHSHVPLPPKTEASEVPHTETTDVFHQPGTAIQDEPVFSLSGDMKLEGGNGGDGEEKKTNVDEKDIIAEATDNGNPTSKHSFLLDDHMYEGNESGTEEDQSNFMKELENFFRERAMEFKPPKFYGEGLNCLKLWRAVTRLGGYDKVTTCKLWRQVGESFKPPKTCTTVSWTFRGFYEKALLDYERHKTRGGELSVPVSSHTEPIIVDTQASGSGRARRDAAARAMQGWHSQRLLGNGEVSDPIIKDKSSMSMQKREKQLKNIGLLKRKKPPYTDVVKAARTKASKSQLDIAVVDVGPPAEWVKINVQRTKDCYEVYALVPGLLREEVRVQSDPAGRLVISGEPEHPDNPWGVTPFKKVVSLPSRIDPHQTSAVVTLHGQLFVRVPFELSE
ncbi:AT-rich interactive domain-containing protein 3-like [Humulus lupulus]|uniref:AT-rich interactive domain-containing protein 3-like n=1 Tax=Humulus lupulus TaxID=3486 RepID=UPI002B40D00B|nr:AT-rich interactive domain-containing protein 3-like [Humulus lupulus]